MGLEFDIKIKIAGNKYTRKKDIGILLYAVKGDVGHHMYVVSINLS